MKRKKLINKLKQTLVEKNITNTTDLIDYDICLNDSDNENGEYHSVKHIVIDNNDIKFIVYPDLDEYSIEDLSCKEISYIIDMLD